MADYLSLIALAKTKGEKVGKAPIVAIARPPPLWRDSDYGMNETVLNDIMPTIVPVIAGQSITSYNKNGLQATSEFETCFVIHMPKTSALS